MDDGAPPFILNRNDGALWWQIAATLAEEVAAGVYPPGDRLPSESQLAERFGVNRHTLRRAVAALQDKGLVRIEQGRGTFVHDGFIDYPLSRRTRFSEIVRAQSRSPSGELLRALVEPASAAAARALGLASGAAVAIVEETGMADGLPVDVVTHHFPADRLPGLIEVFEEERSVTATLRRLGIPDYTRKVTRVSARLPDAAEMRLLRLARSVPVLVTESVNVDPAGTPVEYGVARFAANRVQLLFEP